ncbi:MAG: FtsX-like permease family protein [Bacteroidales bacterium]|nr:FtsX-like permease family protein [Bacteroidales bacterium]
MTFERIIANRMLGRDEHNFSRPLIRIATITIALGVVVMIMAVCILRGFQREITNKVVGFGSHITIRSYGWVNDYDEMPISLSSSELEALRNIPGVSSVQPYAYKGGMMKTDEQILGIILKGLSPYSDTSFFSTNIIRGHLPILNDSAVSNEIAISKRIAQLMKVDTGNRVATYFWSGDNYRARNFLVVGIYNTDLNEFDDHYIIGDIRQVQRLNRWDSSQVAGYELTIEHFDNLYPILQEVKGATRPDLAVTSIREEQPSMFAWLDLLNSNIVLILTIMAIVCAASVASAILIMIFEKTQMIGILKTLGCTNRSIRHIFIIKALSIIAKALIIGNLIALAFALLQYHFHIIALNPESYSMTFVPIELNPMFFITIDLGTIIICFITLLLPSTLISNIHPARTIRVE